MQKKGVVLLITLSVMALISLYIFKNLDNIESLIQKKSINYHKSEAVLLAKQYQDDIVGVINSFTSEENKEKFKESLPIYNFDLSYENNIIIIEYLDYYAKEYQLTDFIKRNSKFKSFIEENTPNKSGKISNYKQFNYIITTYLQQNEDNEIFQRKDEISYFDTGYIKNGMKITSNYLECQFFFVYEDVTTKVRFLYSLKSKEVKEFEIWN